MSIERIFHCDETRPSSGLIFVTDYPGPTLHFCGWDCVMKHAASHPAEEVIPAGPEP